MSFHHVALVTRDLEATHRFYTEGMGFSLAKVVVNPTPEGGWAKHAFYDTDDGFGGEGGLMAFWELHGDYPQPSGGLSTSVGLPNWVNHLAFTAVDETHLEAATKRWLDLGLDVVEIDHEFCRSIYTDDPNGTLVEWCLDARPLDERDRARAEAVVLDPAPDHDEPPRSFTAHQADRSKRPAWWPTA